MEFKEFLYYAGPNWSCFLKEDKCIAVLDDSDATFSPEYIGPILEIMGIRVQQIFEVNKKQKQVIERELKKNKIEFEDEDFEVSNG